MWQRFTERARRVVFFAQEEAARLGENYVGTEHVLLGLVRENDSVAARILDRLGVPLGRIRSDIEKQVTRGHGNLGQDMQLTPRAKRVIDLAYEEARQLNNNYIGTEHLLLGLIREGDGLAARVLVKLGADLERTRREIYQMQEGEQGSEMTARETVRGRPPAAPHLSDEALRVLELARSEVSVRNDRALGTEHLLLAVLTEPDSSLSSLLEYLGISPADLRRRAEQQMGRAQAVPGQPLPLRWHTTRVLDRAYEEARQLRHDKIGAPHLLIALIHEGDSLAAHLLQGAGLDANRAGAQLHSQPPENGEPGLQQLVRRAQEEAERKEQAVVTPEHLLTAMIRERESAAALFLTAGGVDLDQLSAELEAPGAEGAGDPAPEGSAPVAPPLTPRADRIISLASEEARRHQSESIGREHLLLSLALDGESLASQTLRASGISFDRLVSAVGSLWTPGPGEHRAQAGSVRRRQPEHAGPRASEESTRPQHEFHGRLTERARRVVAHAQDEAQQLGENFVGTEHLLLGLVREPDCDAVHVLQQLGIPPGRIRSDIERQITRGHGNLTQEAQLTPRAKRAIDLAHDEARRLNNNYVGTEHLLLGLIREGDGLAARVLVRLEADLERVRREVTAMQHSPPSPTLEGEEIAAPQPLDQSLTRPTAPSVSDGHRQRAHQAVAAVRAAKEQRLTDLVSIQDLSAAQARNILSLARTLKDTGAGDPLAHREILAGKVLAMIFEKPSLRTRVTFETGMFQLGGHAISLQPAEIQLGQRETVADAARNLERWVHGIMARTFRHEHVIELAQHAGVPVINGLTDREHPCQALADFLTIQEKKGRTEGLKLAFIGDGNNVAHSLLLLGAKLGTHITIAGPEGYAPDDEILRQTREAAGATGAQIEVTNEPREAVKDADVVYTDVWASMGQEAEAKERAARFAPYQVNAELVRLAKWDAIVMHDLPAHRGEEITDEVMDGPQSVVFDQAENRLHAQKALLAVLLG